MGERRLAILESRLEQVTAAKGSAPPKLAEATTSLKKAATKLMMLKRRAEEEKPAHRTAADKPTAEGDLQVKRPLDMGAILDVQAAAGKGSSSLADLPKAAIELTDPKQRAEEKHPFDFAVDDSGVEFDEQAQSPVDMPAALDNGAAPNSLEPPHESHELAQAATRLADVKQQVEEQELAHGTGMDESAVE